ncbi:malto-oligosyltrehalose trehalohydrolase [Candidatus Omnitrophota bacterium]
MNIGTTYKSGIAEFVAWAPFLKELSIRIISPKEKLIPMNKYDKGYWKASVSGVSGSTRYFYRLDNSVERPDPASFFQPEGVHGPSQIINHNYFTWNDKSWKGIALEKMIIYELHVGTFTPEGTFEAIISRLDDLIDLGINTIELMPVGQFPGERNWGYDGAYLFAVQNSYGGPDDLKNLVNACHQKGLSVILDVVYNHFGPEGNYLAEYGPYFTDRYKTPWGKAVNFDGQYSDSVRDFFIKNALYWFKNFHFDGLRLDAIHGIFDNSAKHILEELAEAIDLFSKEQSRKYYLIAESDLNDTRVIKNREQKGYGIDAQWSDDFHHTVHSLLTKEDKGYYGDFGKPQNLIKAFTQGFVYSWDYSAFRKRYHGSSSAEVPAKQFVVCIQNHDQIGNRMSGERLSSLVSFEALKLAAATLLVSPYVPLLFMGEEYAEDNPFLYFVNHSDVNLMQAVSEGRKNEFKSFQWSGEFFDPNSKETFLKSKLDWSKRSQEHHEIMCSWYRELIGLRKQKAALSSLNNKDLRVWSDKFEGLFFLSRWHRKSRILCFMNFSQKQFSFDLRGLKGKYRKVIDSCESKWNGPGVLMPEVLKSKTKCSIHPHSFLLYETR